MKLTIDLDKRCGKCGKKGAEERTGYCLSCIADLAEKLPITGCFGKTPGPPKKTGSF